MKKLFLLLALMAFFACKNSTDNHSDQNNETTENTSSTDNDQETEDFHEKQDSENTNSDARAAEDKAPEKTIATHPVIAQIRPANVPMKIDQGKNSMEKLSKIYTKLYKEDIKQLFPNFEYTTDGEGKKIEPVVFFQVFLDEDRRRLIGAFQSDYQQAQGGMGGGGFMGTMFRDLLFLQMVEADGSPIGKALTPVLLEDKRGDTYQAGEAIITKKDISIKIRPYTQNGEPEEGGYVEESKILITPTGLKWK